MTKNTNSNFSVKQQLNLNINKLFSNFSQRFKFYNKKKNLVLFFNVKEFKQNLINFTKALYIILNFCKYFLHYLIINNSSLEYINNYPYFLDFKKIFFESKISLKYGLANHKYNQYICDNFLKIKELKLDQDFIYFFSISEASKVLAQYQSYRYTGTKIYDLEACFLKELWINKILYSDTEFFSYYFDFRRKYYDINWCFKCYNENLIFLNNTDFSSKKGKYSIVLPYFFISYQFMKSYYLFEEIKVNPFFLLKLEFFWYYIYYNKVVKNKDYFLLNINKEYEFLLDLRRKCYITKIRRVLLFISIPLFLFFLYFILSPDLMTLLSFSTDDYVEYVYNFFVFSLIVFFFFIYPLYGF